MPRVHRAAWILPIASPPIKDGWVVVEDGRVAALGSGTPPRDSAPDPLLSADDGAASVILPGLVNAHTHLELTWLQGRVPPVDAMPAWAERLMGVRRAAAADDVSPVPDAIEAARRAGTVLLGDVSNTLASCPALAAGDVSATVFFEQIGFNPPDVEGAVRAARSRVDAVGAASDLRIELAAHAPYSVSPALMIALAAAGTGPFSIHLGESTEELRFLRDGGGAWRSLLERVGAWTADWAPPGATPVEYLDRLGLVNPRLLAVHGVRLTGPDLERLAAGGATVVTCPRSNAWTGAGEPPIAAFYAAGVRIAVGTDSLASVEDLNLFSELAVMRRLAPDVPAAALLASATLAGATALGWEGEYGSIELGKRGALLSVRLPGLSGASAADVEEYLVSGVAPAQVRWLPASQSRAQNPKSRPQ